MTQPTLARHVRGKGRMYVHPITGEEVPSITNCIGVLDKPALPRWAAKMVAESAWKMRGSLDAMGEQEAVDVLKGSPWRNSGRAADRGTGVHEYLAAAAEGAPLPMLEGDALRYKAAADQFLDVWQPEFVASEFTVFGDSYAGTCDALFRSGRRLILADYKSSKALYPEIALQLAAIRFAEAIVDDDGAERPMPEVDDCVGVLLTPDGFEVRLVDAAEDAYGAFRACLTLWRWVNGPNPVGLDATPDGALL